MKTLWHVSRITLGLVFMFSGFVKGIDPWGSAYKFTDYFHAWGMESLLPSAFLLGVLLSASEFLIGVALTANVSISFFSILSLLFTIFFTGLTLVVALYDPVTDCGCFGDALKLTNWQTFFKNICLLAFALVVFRYRKKFKPAQLSLVRMVLGVITLVAYGYLAAYSFHHLPVIDFLPYRVGTNISEAMKIPQDAPKDVYKNTFCYKNRKTGEEKKFTEENYPWQDSLNWEFVSMDTRLIRKGYEPPIHNFTIETAEGEDVKDFFLSDPGYTFIFVVYDQGKAGLSPLQAIRTLADYAFKNRISFIGLTSSAPGQTELFRTKNDLRFEFFNGDETTLKTMIRSNPGLILIREGVILDKWHYNDFPTIGEIENELRWLEKQKK